MISAADLVIPRFHDVLGDVMAHGHTHYWLHGGRGSTKSSFISLCIVLLVISQPKANAVVVRRFGNTLRDSVYQQILWAISSLGLEGYFRARLSPMEITYLPTGQKIVFRGADDPLKLKGVKFTKGYAAVVWFEELDQFDGIEAVRSILNSLRRGGDDFWIFYSYNPPRTMWSWVNVECLDRTRRADTFVRRSSYLDVVDEHPEWLGAPFIDEAEYLRDVNETAWRWEYLGEITGTGGNVLDNVIDESLSLHRIRNFERTRNGVDWGWFPDPWRFVRCAWEPAARRLLIFEEHSANKKTPAETGQMLVNAMTFSDEEGEEPYYHDELVWADNTPDGKQQVAVYRRDFGIRIRPSRKARMRKLSYEWLAGLREIVIDPVRCPLTFEEFILKEYLRDRDSTWIDEIPDGNDHSIDAVRYAMMDDILRG
ncbi:phage terminase large subunit [Olsenella sp. oral taxon 809 str. F0356]|uniref:PBSX family phage terminase large subunit n=1 Tax=Olsenella sp. oral taxon 809 TaxID=661086 RepID=UPI000231ED9B|nr:phage terminase large subunit [Olsenella sp. oral taxon 809]EHF02191.1 phage terminase large subunit [Olsenella sp. oral taxon 809 str. F0356]